VFKALLTYALAFKSISESHVRILVALKRITKRFTLSRYKHVAWSASFNTHQHILWATIHLILLGYWHAVLLVPSPLINLSYTQACLLWNPFALLVTPGWISFEFESKGLFLVRVLLCSWLCLFLFFVIFLFTRFWFVFIITCLNYLFLIGFLFSLFIGIWEERLWYTEEHFRKLVFWVLIFLWLQALQMWRCCICDVSKSSPLCLWISRSSLTVFILLVFRPGFNLVLTFTIEFRVVIRGWLSILSLFWIRHHLFDLFLARFRKGKFKQMRCSWCFRRWLRFLNLILVLFNCLFHLLFKRFWRRCLETWSSGFCWKGVRRCW